jgi:hypothetical protein
MFAGYQWTWTTDICRCVDEDPEVAPELKAILLTAVDGDPDRRFSSAVELRVAIAAYLEQIWPGRAW